MNPRRTTCCRLPLMIVMLEVLTSLHSERIETCQVGLNGLIEVTEKDTISSALAFVDLVAIQFDDHFAVLSRQRGCNECEREHNA